MSREGVALCAVVMAIGLVGTLVPLLPGLALIWGTALVYGLVDGFGTVGTVAFVMITALFAASLISKVVLPGRRGRSGGVPAAALAIGALGAAIGFFVIPVVGLIVGAVCGVLLAEYARTRDWKVAWRGTRAVAAGVGLAIALEIAAGIFMILVWGTWVWVGRSM